MKSVPSVQQFKSRKEWKDSVWKIITTGLADATSSQDIEKSLAMLITAYEKEQIIKRAAAVSLLKQGKSYREIGDLLWLSHPTISAVKKSIRSGEGYVSVYKWGKINKSKKRTLAKQEGIKLEFSLLLDALFTIPSPPPSHRSKVTMPHGQLVFPQKRR